MWNQQKLIWDANKEKWDESEQHLVFSWVLKYSLPSSWYQLLSAFFKWVPKDLCSLSLFLTSLSRGGVKMSNGQQLLNQGLLTAKGSWCLMQIPSFIWTWILILITLCLFKLNLNARPIYFKIPRRIRHYTQDLVNNQVDIAVCLVYYWILNSKQCFITHNPVHQDPSITAVLLKSL